MAVYAFGPDSMSPALEAACTGYLSATADALPDLFVALERLVVGRRPSEREQAIVAAVRWGVNHSQAWTEMQKPRKMKKRPPDVAIEEVDRA